jgi:hypothetical protein
MLKTATPRPGDNMAVLSVLAVLNRGGLEAFGPLLGHEDRRTSGLRSLETCGFAGNSASAPDRIRTCDLRFRRPTREPTNWLEIPIFQTKATVYPALCQAP